MWTSLTAEGVEVLGLAIYQCLQCWTALQLAVHNEWGGPSSALKCQQFHSDILDFFTGSKKRRYIDELEDLLDQSMLELFNTEIEDGSLFEVAEQMMTVHEECALGNFEKVKQLFNPASKSGQSVLDSKLLPLPDEGVENSSVDHHSVMPGVESEGMDIEDSSPVAKPASTSASKATRTSMLTELEVAEGWQEVPARKGRHGKV